jgi:hypothetical protein
VNRRKSILLGSIAVVLTGVGVWALVSFRSPAPTADPVTVAKYVASDKFVSLPSDKQKAYIESLMQNRDAMRDLDPEVRRAAWEVMGEYRERERLREYFKMTPAERKQHLDDVIKAEEERRQQWQQRAATRPTSRPAGEGWGGRGGDGQGGNRPQVGGGGGPGGRGSPERQKARLENTDPGMRAMASQYRADMAQRRAELGIPGGGGRGPR